MGSKEEYDALPVQARVTKPTAVLQSYMMSKHLGKRRPQLQHQDLGWLQCNHDVGREAKIFRVIGKNLDARAKDARAKNARANSWEIEALSIMQCPQMWISNSAQNVESQEP